jgi:hypothetical protein
MARKAQVLARKIEIRFSGIPKTKTPVKLISARIAVITDEILLIILFTVPPLLC